MGFYFDFFCQERFSMLYQAARETANHDSCINPSHHMDMEDHTEQNNHGRTAFVDSS
jgi:hypothetical protein